MSTRTSFSAAENILLNQDSSSNQVGLRHGVPCAFVHARCGALLGTYVSSSSSNDLYGVAPLSVRILEGSSLRVFISERKMRNDMGIGKSIILHKAMLGGRVLLPSLRFSKSSAVSETATC